FAAGGDPDFPPDFHPARSILLIQIIRENGPIRNRRQQFCVEFWVTFSLVRESFCSHWHSRATRFTAARNDEPSRISCSFLAIIGVGTCTWRGRRHQMGAVGGCLAGVLPWAGRAGAVPLPGAGLHYSGL